MRFMSVDQVGQRVIVVRRALGCARFESAISDPPALPKQSSKGQPWPKQSRISYINQRLDCADITPAEFEISASRSDVRSVEDESNILLTDLLDRLCRESGKYSVSLKIAARGCVHRLYCVKH